MLDEIENYLGDENGEWKCGIFVGTIWKNFTSCGSEAFVSFCYSSSPLEFRFLNNYGKA